MDTIIVQVQFSAKTPYGEFRDALNIPKEEYDTFTQEDIENTKAERVAKWVEFMNNQPSGGVETKSQLQEKVSVLSKRITELNSKITGM